MRNFSLLLSGLFLMVFWSGCTIEKRHYQKGYHVEWKSRKESTKSSENRDDIAHSNVEPLELPISDQDSINTPVPVVSNSESNTADSNLKKPNRSISRNHQTRDEKPNHRHEIFSGRTGVEYPPDLRLSDADDMAQKSLDFGIATWLSFALSLLLNFADVAPVLTALLTLASLIFAIFAIVFGNWAKRQMIQEPGNYVNKRKAITGLVLGWVYIVLVIIGILATLILILYLLSLL